MSRQFVVISIAVASLALVSGCKKKQRKDAPQPSASAAPSASPVASPAASEAAKAETTTVAGGFDPMAEKLAPEHEALGAALVNLFWPGNDDGELHGDAYFAGDIKLTTRAAAGPTTTTISDGKKLDETLKSLLESAKAGKASCTPADSCCTFAYDQAASPLPDGTTVVHKVCFNLTGKDAKITELEVGPRP